MTNGTATEPAALKLTKGENWGQTIYTVELDGVKVGWVLHDIPFGARSGHWSFYAHTREGIKAERIASGATTRRDAIMDGISHLEIYRSGWVVVFNRETIKDEEKVIEPARLRALWQKLLDDKYPSLKENS